MGLVPLGDLCRFCLVALRLCQAVMLQIVTCVCCVLSNDAILGSEDVVP